VSYRRLAGKNHVGVGGGMRDPPDTLEEECREGEGKAGQPCGAITATSLLYSQEPLSAKPTDHFLYYSHYIFSACPECCLPLRAYSHARCQGAPGVGWRPRYVWEDAGNGEQTE
jgi:hypothetical protein